MNWGPFIWVADHLRTILAGVGFTGGGVGLLTYMKHMPAPRRSSIWWASVFDTCQDLVKNNERIGQRRDADSVFVQQTEKGHTSSAQSVTLSPEDVPVAKAASGTGA